MKGNDASKIIDRMLSAKQGPASFLTEEEKEALKTMLHEHRMIKTVINHLKDQRDYAENNHKAKSLIEGIKLSIDAIVQLTDIEEEGGSNG
jgi:hypothetical protein